MDNENTGSISCIAVGDMLKKKLVSYTDALANGASERDLAVMGDEIDNKEAVHDKCVAMGDVTDIGSHGDNVTEEESGSSIEEESDVYAGDEGDMFEEDEEN